MDKTYFLTMARYNRWANKKLYDVVETLSHEAFEKDQGAYFRSVQGTLNHLLFGDWAWTLRLKGKSSSHLVMDKIYHADVASLKKARILADEEFIATIEGMSSIFIDGDLSYKNVAGQDYSQPVTMVLAHMVNHGTHHRGQVHCLLTQMGVDAPSLDLIFYMIDCQNMGIEA